jgi:hypothetical protein
MESREQGTGSGAGVVNTINLDRAFVFGSRFNQGSLTNLFHGDHASQAPPAPVKDEWIGGERSLPSREGFMVGPEKLQSVADLRQAVLDCKGGDVVAAVGALGMGGVGKSIACLLVAKDDAVRGRYSDATLWINLGIDATAEVVVDQMAAVVEHTGGARTARLMRDIFRDHGAQKIGAIRGKARDWFYGRRVLLVLDNLFPRTRVAKPSSWAASLQSVSSAIRDLFSSRSAVQGAGELVADDGSTPRFWLQFLKEMLGPDSCVLFSTRVLEVTIQNDAVVAFKAMDSSQEQRELFFAHLGECQSGLHSSEVEELLRFCCGLHIALATVAALVRRSIFDWPLKSRRLQDSIWDPSSPGLGSGPRFSARGGHDGLAAVFSVGLRALDESSEFSVHPKYGWTDLYISLGIFRQVYSLCTGGVTCDTVGDRCLRGREDMQWVPGYGARALEGGHLRC